MARDDAATAASERTAAVAMADRQARDVVIREEQRVARGAGRDLLAHQRGRGQHGGGEFDRRRLDGADYTAFIQAGGNVGDGNDAPRSPPDHRRHRLRRRRPPDGYITSEPPQRGGRAGVGKQIDLLVAGQERARPLRVLGPVDEHPDRGGLRLAGGEDEDPAGGPDGADPHRDRAQRPVLRRHPEGRGQAVGQPRHVRGQAQRARHVVRDVAVDPDPEQREVQPAGGGDRVLVAAALRVQVGRRRRSGCRSARGEGRCVPTRGAP